MGYFYLYALIRCSQRIDNGFERQFENIAMNSMFIWAQELVFPMNGFKIGRKIRLKLQDIETLKQRVQRLNILPLEMLRGVFGGSSYGCSEIKIRNYNVYGDYPVLQKLQLKTYMKEVRFINE